MQPIGEASLHLETTGSRVRTRVTRRTPEGLTVTQALPFLKLRSGVRDQEGRSAHIEWVSVDIDGDTPQLVMELSYDAPERADETIPELELEKRRDETVPFEIEIPAARKEVVISDHAELAPRSEAPLAPIRAQRTFAEHFAAALADVRADLARLFLFLGQRLAV